MPTISFRNFIAHTHVYLRFMLRQEPSKSNPACFSDGLQTVDTRNRTTQVKKSSRNKNILLVSGLSFSKVSPGTYNQLGNGPSHIPKTSACLYSEWDSCFCCVNSLEGFDFDLPYIKKACDVHVYQQGIHYVLSFFLLFIWSKFN